MKVTGTVGVPGVSSKGIEISGEYSRSIEYNEQDTWSESKAVELPVVVPPQKAIIGTATWQEYSLSVPFSAKGMGTFASGVKAPVSFNGTYVGIASSAVVTRWKEVAPGEEKRALAMLAVLPGTPVP
jgi:hypothetical protein